jgi:hypothetical protein
MTIDEAIAMLKFNNRHIADLGNDDLQQLAEWLEELKEMRKNQGQIADFWYQEGISRESKLIFDKIEEIKNRYDNEDFAIIGILIKIQEIALENAEHLKVGGDS